ncbi:MAG: tetratricopeptide repeat protein [Candidatus Zixiibacteriota bacterium]
MRKGKVRKPKPAGITVEAAFRYGIMPVMLLLVIGHLLTTYWMTPFLWGIHYLYFLPRWTGWLLTIMTVSLFVPPVNSLVLKLLASSFNALRSVAGKIKRGRLFAATGLLAIPFFWALRTRLFLLGDGYFKIATLPTQAITPTEPLDGIIHHQFYRLLTLISPGINPSFSYTILSVVCGGIFIFLILLLSDLLGETAFKKLLIFFSLLTLGSIELFFGYVESYTILLVGLTLLVWLSIRHIQNKINIILPFIVLTFSIGVHVSAIVFIPGFLYLTFWRWRKEKGRTPDVFAVLSLLGCLAIIFLAVWKVFLLKGEGNRFGQFVPILPSVETKFTMFSGAHFLEFVNQLLLVSPVGIILFLFVVYYLLRTKSFHDPIVNFLLISSLSGLFLVFIYNAHLGHADWDLRSFPGVFLTLLGILMFIRWGSAWARFKNYGVILIGLSFFHVVPWIVVNASTKMSLDRYVMTTVNDPHLRYVRGGGIWRGARVLNQAGYPERAQEIAKQGVEKDTTDIANYSYLGVYLSSQGKYDEAIVYLEKALSLSPARKLIRCHLCIIYLMKGDADKAMSYLENTELDEPSDSLFVIDIVKPLIKAHRFEAAKRILHQYLDKNQGTANLRGLLGALLFLQGDASGAQREWKQALTLDPNEAVAQKGMKQLRRVREK